MSKPRSAARVKTLPAAIRENLIATPGHSSAFSTPSRISADRRPVTQSNFSRARATANPSGLSIAPPSKRPEGFLSKDEKPNNGPSATLNSNYAASSHSYSSSSSSSTNSGTCFARRNRHASISMDTLRRNKAIDTITRCLGLAGP